MANIKLIYGMCNMTGQNLLNLALSEPPTSSFRRHLYLDALTYLLRALPSDLTPSEITHLLSSLPTSLLAYLSRSQQPLTSSTESQARSIEHPTIHSLLLVLTATTVSTIRHLTPHLKSAAKTTWEFNLKHRVAERSIEKVRGTVNSTWAFWRGVAEWVMFEDEENLLSGETEATSTEMVHQNRKVRYGGKVIRDAGKYASGVISSSMGGVIDGFVEGMKK